MSKLGQCCLFLLSIAIALLVFSLVFGIVFVATFAHLFVAGLGKGGAVGQSLCEVSAFSKCHGGNASDYVSFEHIVVLSRLAFNV